MIELRKYIKLLGFKAEDKVTGFKGVITSITFDLYGCVQALVNPGIGKDDKLLDSVWLDTNRLKISGNGPIMPVPAFDYDKGPENKPMQKI